MERGVSATIVLLYAYTESAEKKNYDEEGKEMKGKKCSPDLAGFELSDVGL